MRQQIGDIFSQRLECVDAARNAGQAGESQSIEAGIGAQIPYRHARANKPRHEFLRVRLVRAQPAAMGACADDP